MPKYRWKCKNCDTINVENEKFCGYCDLRYNASASEVEMFQQEALNGPIKPSISIFTLGLWGEEFAAGFTKTASCPKCKLKMYNFGKTCPHCSHHLNRAEREALEISAKKAWFKGAVYAVAVFTIVPLFFVALAKYF